MNKIVCTGLCIQGACSNTAASGRGLLGSVLSSNDFCQSCLHFCPVHHLCMLSRSLPFLVGCDFTVCVRFWREAVISTSLLTVVCDFIARCSWLGNKKLKCGLASHVWAQSWVIQNLFRRCSGSQWTLHHSQHLKQLLYSLCLLQAVLQSLWSGKCRGFNGTYYISILPLWLMRKWVKEPCHDVIYVCVFQIEVVHGWPWIWIALPVPGGACYTQDAWGSWAEDLQGFCYHFCQGVCFHSLIILGGKKNDCNIKFIVV